jgi:glutamate 5-kinase
MDSDRKLLTKAKLLVVKLGTGVLSASHGGLNARRIADISQQVSFLRKKKILVVLVSSGAIGAGMARLKLKARPGRIDELQACAAVGQNLLMTQYERAFKRLKLTVAQILLTHEDLRHPQRRENARHTLRRLLDHKVVPVINENDATSFAEIKFGDNDQLAAMVHELLNADACILLTNVDGFCLESKRAGSGISKKVIPTIRKITSEIELHAGGAESHRSIGGMKSKFMSARRVLATNRPLIIASGRTRNVLPRLISGEALGTIFLP